MKIIATLCNFTYNYDCFVIVLLYAKIVLNADEKADDVLRLFI